jgi:hypothetical protein
MMRIITWQSNDGVLLVWNDGFSVACQAVSSPSEIAGFELHKKRDGPSINISVWLQLYVLLSVPRPLG